MSNLSVGIDINRRLEYPQPQPRGLHFYPVDYPEQGRYYRVISRGVTLEGYLDRISKLSNGLIVGFIYDADGELVDSAPINKYSTWLRAVAVEWVGKF